MREIAEFYDIHLAELRKLADEQKIHFVRMIARLIVNHPGKKPYGILTPGMENEKTEEMLIALYRTIFYEQFANIAIEHGDSRINVLAQNKANDIAKQARELIEQQNLNLGTGRKKGTESSKAKGAKIKALALGINDDVLKHPDTARWGLDKRAEHIESKLPTKRALSTIKGWITGT